MSYDWLQLMTWVYWVYSTLYPFGVSKSSTGLYGWG